MMRARQDVALAVIASLAFPGVGLAGKAKLISDDLAELARTAPRDVIKWAAPPQPPPPQSSSAAGRKAGGIILIIGGAALAVGAYPWVLRRDRERKRQGLSRTDDNVGVAVWAGMLAGGVGLMSVGATVMRRSSVGVGIHPPLISFDNVPVGGHSEKTATIQNYYPYAVQVTRIGLPGAFTLAEGSPQVPVDVPANDKVDFPVRFLPTGKKLISGSMEVVVSDNRRELKKLRIQLRGRGVQ